MREKTVERKLVKAVRDSGGLALKFVSPGMAGVPDRLVLFKGGKAAFCEVKAPGEKPRPLQEQFLLRPYSIRNGKYFIPDTPGIGAPLDIEKLTAIAERVD